ncbi:hypothetical protein PC9H_010219 [Pleurotus ostreatus]|nr:uncharacterized protein PC9H_010219 [Pleurotus ostreatus]KAF7424908.1 hypothetical protein PC9H_010219 [Pleurotus ostreatus]KAJ8692065.1 hypothetical protein PTI98_009406 [Pleurotus ostreatus]KAJ8693812.1 hypothetical protein PTI98_008769 [Pleurotus ostreatus]
MAHSTSSLCSSSAEDELIDKPTRRRHAATPPSARVADASLETSRAIVATVKRLTESRSTKAGGVRTQAALAVVEKKLSLPELTEQVERLVASESADARDEIASTLAGMLEKDNADFTAELKSYNIDLSVIIKQAVENVESSPASAWYLKKAPSETSADTGSPDRSRQASHSHHPRSLSSSRKSDFFSSSKNFASFAIDTGGQIKELKAELSQAQNLLAAKKGLEESWQRERDSWERERAGWAKLEQRLQEVADVFKQDKADYKREKENLIEKWESRHAEAKAEWEKQAKKWEDRYESELQKREVLEEELKALRERLRPSA